MWQLAQVNQVWMSTIPWCCITTTVPAGATRSSSLFRSTCFGGRTSALSFDIAPVSENRFVGLFIQERLSEHIFGKFSHILIHRRLVVWMHEELHSSQLEYLGKLKIKTRHSALTPLCPAIPGTSLINLWKKYSFSSLASTYQPSSLVLSPHRRCPSV